MRLFRNTSGCCKGLYAAIIAWAGTAFVLCLSKQLYANLISCSRRSESKTRGTHQSLGPSTTHHCRETRVYTPDSGPRNAANVWAMGTPPSGAASTAASSRSISTAVRLIPHARSAASNSAARMTPLPWRSIARRMRANDRNPPGEQK